MNKFLLALGFLLISTITAFTQFEAKFGKISVEEDDLKECAFNPEASAAILVDEGLSDYTDDDELMTFYHERIKVLKEEGKKYADVKIRFHSEDDFEYVDHIEAMVINIDAAGRREEFPLD